MRGIRLRLERADEHLAFLKDKRRSFLEDERRDIIGSYEADTSEYVFRITGEPPAIEWALRTSEFAHHLRSALDNLVWALVYLRGNTGHRQTKFVIATTEDAWKRSTTTTKRWTDALRGLLPEDRAIIQALQPYERGEYLATSHPLAHLARMSNVDKHLLMPPVFFTIAARRLWIISDADVKASGSLDVVVPDNDTTGRAGDIRFDPGLESGDYTEVVRAQVPDPGPNPKMRMQGKFTADIAFGYADGPLTFNQLMAIREEVQLVVRLFEDEFA